MYLHIQVISQLVIFIQPIILKKNRIHIIKSTALKFLSSVVQSWVGESRDPDGS